MEKYRYSRRQPPQIDIYTNVTVYGGVYVGNQDPVVEVDYRPASRIN